MVKKGEPLADVLSTELAAKKKEYRIKKAQWKNDRWLLLRARQRRTNSDAISQQPLVDAQCNESRSLLEFQIARGKLQFFGLEDDAIEGIEKEDEEQLARLTLRSPISGTVLEVGAEAGRVYDSKSDLILIAPYSAKESGPSR
jgi:membrane fusion protein, heavy metal efflux system